MRLTPLVYGSLIATAFMGGVAIYYQAAPTHSIRAPDVAEIVEGTLERSAAIGWQHYYWLPNTTAGWGYYAVTNATNVTDYMFNFYPDNPVIGSVPSRDLIIRTLLQIQDIGSNFVQSYTATGITYWTSTGLWEAASVGGGIYSNWTIAATNGIPIYGPATNLSYAAQTNVLFEAYRILRLLTNTAQNGAFATTNSLWGDVTDPISWDTYDQTGPDYEPDDPAQFDWIYNLNSNGFLGSTLTIPTAPPDEWHQPSGSTERGAYLAGPKAASIHMTVFPRVYTATWREGTGGWAIPPWTHYAIARGYGSYPTFPEGDFPCFRKQSKTEGYISCGVPDLGTGVTARVDVSACITGTVATQTGYDYATMSITNTEFFQATNVVWTNICGGTITGSVQSVTNRLAPTIAELFPNLSPGIDGFLPPYPYEPEGYQELLDIEVWYEFRRPTVVIWDFRYCK